MADQSDVFLSGYVSHGAALGQMVANKQMAYGDAFGQSHKVLEILYPAGVSLGQMKDFLTVVRIIDKLFRIANRKDAFGENPWEDIAGYALLESCRRNEREGAIKILD